MWLGTDRADMNSAALYIVDVGQEKKQKSMLFLLQFTDIILISMTDCVETKCFYKGGTCLKCAV